MCDNCGKSVEELRAEVVRVTQLANELAVYMDERCTEADLDRDNRGRLAGLVYVVIMARLGGGLEAMLQGVHWAEQGIAWVEPTEEVRAAEVAREMVALVREIAGTIPVVMGTDVAES